MSESTTPKEKLKLSSVKVIFANLTDEGFGRSITVDVTDKDTQKLISDWVKANDIGKKPNNGVANFKTYEDVVQYSFKLNDGTKFAYRTGVKEGDLGYGSVVTLAANAFEYDNKFGKGVSSSLSAVVVEKGRASGGDADLAELLEELGDEDITEGGEKVDLSDVPF